MDDGIDPRSVCTRIHTVKLGEGSLDLARDRLGDCDLSKETLQEAELPDLLEVDKAARVRYDSSHVSIVAFSRSHSSSVVR